jgi:hypothetical protein
MTHPAADLEQKLIDRVATFRTDPLGFVIFAFPWGEAGTALADASGPWDWQRELLDELGRKLREGHARSASWYRSLWRAPAATASARALLFPG